MLIQSWPYQTTWRVIKIFKRKAERKKEKEDSYNTEGQIKWMELSLVRCIMKATVRTSWTSNAGNLSLRRKHEMMMVTGSCLKNVNSKKKTNKHQKKKTPKLEGFWETMICKFHIYIFSFTKIVQKMTRNKSGRKKRHSVPTFLTRRVPKEISV